MSYCAVFGQVKDYRALVRAYVRAYQFQAIVHRISPIPHLCHLVMVNERMIIKTQQVAEGLNELCARAFSSQQNDLAIHPHLSYAEWNAFLYIRDDTICRINILQEDSEEPLPEAISKVRRRRLQICRILRILVDHLLVGREELALRRKNYLRLFVTRILELRDNFRAEDDAWRQLIVHDAQNAKLWAKTRHDSRHPFGFANDYMTLVSLISVWGQENKNVAESVIIAADYTSREVSSFGADERETLSALEDKFTLYSERWSAAVTESYFPQCSVQ